MEQRADLQRELDRLRDQIFDPLRPGCGERCDIHIDNIQRILGKPLSDTARPPLGSPRETVQVWYDGLVTSAQRDLEAAAQTTYYPETAAVLDQIAQLLAAYDTPKRALAANEGLAILSDLGDATEEIERRTNAILPIDDKVTLAPIDRTMGRLGEIVYSFENAFKERPNILATILSLILATIIDIFPVIFALVAFTPEAGRVLRRRRPRSARRPQDPRLTRTRSRHREQDRPAPCPIHPFHSSTAKAEPALRDVSQEGEQQTPRGRHRTRMARSLEGFRSPLLGDEIAGRTGNYVVSFGFPGSGKTTLHAFLMRYLMQVGPLQDRADQPKVSGGIDYEVNRVVTEWMKQWQQGRFPAPNPAEESEIRELGFAVQPIRGVRTPLEFSILEMSGEMMQSVSSARRPQSEHLAGAAGFLRQPPHPHRPAPARAPQGARERRALHEPDAVSRRQS